MILDKLPNNHFKVEEIVKVLKKHTAKNPVVDLQFLMDNLQFMDTARNYTIKLVKKDAKTGEVKSFGHVVVVVEKNLDLELLKDEIKKTYKRVTGQFVEPEKKVVAKTTQVDDLNGSNSDIRINKKSKAAYGKKIESGDMVVDKAGIIE